ncbi:P27 family phage terminase small subunit [Aeromicrobium sp. CTD01-1L150]|uniref:P27 family phage terminase small subunit n=1 Tax=Aeromicrobium sp. CTD01-1L150 TaxID=3341830 RepID=UPI0035C045A1
MTADTEGDRLHADVLAAYDLDPAEQALLAQACRTLDELNRISDELATAQLMVTGSTGQPVPNPLLEQARAHRRVLDALARSLALPVDGEQHGTRRSPQQSKAAAQRHRGDRLRAVRTGVTDGTA